MKYASCRYIMFLDSDDYLQKDTVKILKRRLWNTEYDAIFFDSDIYFEENCKLAIRNIYDRSLASLDEKQMSGWEYFSKCYPRNYVVSACMAVYKKDVIEYADIHFPEGRYYEDNYFTFAFIDRAEHVIHISDKLYQRRYREHSITLSEYSEKKFVDCMEVSRLVWRDVCKSKYENVPELRELLLELISDQCIRSLKDYYTCIEQEIILKNETTNLLIKMLNEYVDLLEKSCLNVDLLDLSVLVRIQTAFYYISRWKLIETIDLNPQIKKIVKAQKKLYINKLKELPFGEKECRVGIYGTGKHTEGLLLLYEKLIGKIKCNLVFIDSIKGNESYRNKKLVNVQGIGELELDLIVVSSFIYEQEMVHNIKRTKSEIPMYTFYEKLNEDIFSNYNFFLEYC